MYGVKLEGVAEIKNETETEAGTTTSKDKDNADANENASAGKKSRETQKPSAKTVKAATEKLDGEIKDINMEYDKAVREIRQKEDAGSRQSALRSAGANRDRQLAKAVGQFSESSTSGKKGTIWKTSSRICARKVSRWRICRLRNGMPCSKARV